MAKILIFGARSFVGKGLLEFLERQNHVVQMFSHGECRRDNKYIWCDYLQLSSCTFWDEQYDIVINLVVLKDQSVEDNIQYIHSLIDFCNTHHVKKLIHFSSIMVYNYGESVVSEQTPIARLSETYMQGYGRIKIAVDEYLLTLRQELDAELVLVRPGYVLADNRPCPFIINLPLGIHLIKGDKRSKQPIVLREDIHRALAAIIATEHNNPVYHFFPSDGMTKLRYAQQTVGGLVLTMPKWLFERIPYALAKLHVIPWSLYSRFQGMYIYSDFQSVQTEQKLQIHFNSLA